ncbi:MAG: hypothetical protein EOO04_02310 [Chitinophagaceae bacterium]|nr:MAG: hypothetical protein EOO04_02310 [Chitinophagaceae bacterium]
MFRNYLLIAWRSIRKNKISSVINLTGLTVGLTCSPPAAWWAMSGWFQNFNYRVELSWWIFVIAAISSVIISLITVSFQVVRTAISNPIKNLKAD